MIDVKGRKVDAKGLWNFLAWFVSILVVAIVLVVLCNSFRQCDCWFLNRFLFQVLLHHICGLGGFSLIWLFALLFPVALFL